MSQPIDLALLTQAWAHSHEEDTPDSIVYRRADFPFPPSRGRKGFELKSDGTLLAKRPGPTDQTQHIAGNWKLSGQELELHPAGAGAQVLCIQSVEPDRLIVSKTPSCNVS